jgi:hypothetical protein
MFKKIKISISGCWQPYQEAEFDYDNLPARSYKPIIESLLNRIKEEGISWSIKNPSVRDMPEWQILIWENEKESPYIAEFNVNMVPPEFRELESLIIFSKPLKQIREERIKKEKEERINLRQEFKNRNI